MAEHHWTASSLSDSNVLQDDLAALLRAAGLPDGPRPASPHQVIQHELLPQVQYLAARERVLAERVTILESQIQEQRNAIKQEVLRALDGHTFTAGSSITYVANSLGFPGGVLDKAGVLHDLDTIFGSGD